MIGELEERAKEFIENIDFSEELLLDEEVGIYKKNISIKNMPLDMELLTVEVKQHLNKCLSYLGYEINPHALKVLNDSLVGESLLCSTDGSKLLREDFQDNLIEFAELLTIKAQDENFNKPSKHIVSKKAMKLYKRNKWIKRIALTISVLLSINVIMKLFNGVLTNLDILGIVVFVCMIVFIIILFKISDNKYRELEDEDFEDYKKNINEVENEIFKIKVIDNIDYNYNKREVHSTIMLYNLTDHSLEYVEGEVEFYYGGTSIYPTQFSEKEINPYGSILLYDRYLVTDKAKHDWSSFKVRIIKLITQNRTLKDITLYSGSTFKTHRTLLNSYYLPVIYELFGYESSWAIEVMKRQYWKVTHYMKHINPKRFLVLLGYTLISLFILIFSVIGIYNFLYVPIELIFN